MRIDHIALTVGDRERSARFYARHFGFDERVHDDAHLLILSNEHGDLLALSEGPVPSVPRTNHFGLRAPSADAVRSAREGFRREGVGEAEFQESGPTRVQVFDPDGYRVEIYAF